ncbi:hypothetical protein T484DRAFT_1756609 [Baffinella frigidus]|nr:hypothetical protein T484DRAFT_1756609 [Cryptophyta sp. CCMP2293]
MTSTTHGVGYAPVVSNEPTAIPWPAGVVRSTDTSNGVTELTPSEILSSIIDTIKTLNLVTTSLEDPAAISPAILVFMELTNRQSAPLLAPPMPTFAPSMPLHALSQHLHVSPAPLRVPSVLLHTPPVSMPVLPTPLPTPSTTPLRTKRAREEDLVNPSNPPETVARIKAEKTFQCPVCAQMFSQRANMKGHIESIHNKVKYQCSICDEHLSSKTNLNHHMKKTHAAAGVYCAFKYCTTCDVHMRGDLARHTRSPKHQRKLAALAASSL